MRIITALTPAQLADWRANRRAIARDDEALDLADRRAELAAITGGA